MSHFTVLGAQGFIGSRLVAHLRDEGHRVNAPPRHAAWTSEPLGHVIYAAGVTHDFAARPYDTIAAHVSRLTQLLAEGAFDSLLYLSSTRVYQGLTGIVDEAADLCVNPARPGDLYNLSKLAGESVLLNSGRPAKVVRLSNVYDASDRSQAFLPSVLRAATQQGAVTFQSGPASTRDCVSLRDVVRLLPQVALGGRHALYNLASGRNVTHRQLAHQLAAHTGCRVDYDAGAVDHVMPQISIRRLIDEFDFRPAELFDDLPQLLAAPGARRETVPC